MTCLGVLKRGERGKDNGTGLKEGGGIKILTTVLHSRCSLLRFEYSPVVSLERSSVGTIISNTCVPSNRSKCVMTISLPSSVSEATKAAAARSLFNLHFFSSSFVFSMAVASVPSLNASRAAS